jgi:hypothetical protein
MRIEVATWSAVFWVFYAGSCCVVRYLNVVAAVTFLFIARKGKNMTRTQELLIPILDIHNDCMTDS